MALLFCLLSIIVLVYSGYACMAAALPDRVFARDHRILNYCIALGLGFGITSVFYFLGMLFSGYISIGLTEGILIFVLSGSSLIIFRKRDGKIASRVFDKPQKTDRIILFIFLAIITMIILRLIIRTLEDPHGHFDARFIWNLRARFLYRGWDNWQTAFSPLLNWTHNDYPLLLSLSVVRMWNYIGKESIVAPAGIAFLFTTATVAVTYSSLSVLRNRTQGILAACILAAPTFYIEHGASQTGDIPIGFYFLLTMVLVTLYDTSISKNRGLLFLAGIIASFAAWTKNEGMLFLLLFIAVRIVLSLKQQRGRAVLKDILSILYGALPVLVLLIYFKIVLAPPNDIVHSTGLQIAMMKLVDPSRYAEAAKAIMAQIHFKGVMIAILLALYLIIVKIGFSPHEKRSIYSMAIMISLMFIGYYFVYVITPADINRHVSTSMDRLTLQLWPCVVFLFFMIASQPECPLLRPESGDCMSRDS
jgi:hypothetical protein